MRKNITLIIFLFFLILASCIYYFYYSFFLKPITKEEAGIIEYSSLLSIENNTKSKMYIVLNYNFSKDEINDSQKKNRYIVANDYFSKDTIILGGINDYSNNEIFKFSGIEGKPEILPNNFSLSILDSSKRVLKHWDKIKLNESLKLNYNRRTIRITNKNGNFIIK
jgi:hypothetical protein